MKFFNRKSKKPTIKKSTSKISDTRQNDSTFKFTTEKERFSERCDEYPFLISSAR